MSAQSQPQADAGDADLELDLESALPPRMRVGRGTALFLSGTCFHRRQAVRGLDLVAAGERRPVENFGMPRLDLMRALHPGLDVEELSTAAADPGSAEDPNLHAYRSGFWATLPLAAPAGPGEIELTLEARLEDGGVARAPLGRIAVAERTPPPERARPSDPGGELIAICMATFEPDPELLRTQVESIRAQTDRSWICLISDDCSSPAAYEAIRELIGDDPRFELSRSPRRLGFYRNFERALEMVPAEAALVALSDQDDRWYPEKLSALRAALRGGAQLAYSDQRLLSRDGELIAPSYWTERANNHTNFASLLIANTVTGGASLMRRDVVDLALPFPAVPGVQYHDHWLALVALATGEISYVDRPLYDYVQHGAAALGHGEANLGVTRSGIRNPRQRLRLWRRSLDDWRFAYFAGYLRTKVLAEALEARCAGGLARGRRRILRRLARAERSPAAAAWLVARLGRKRFGRTETLDAERLLLRGIAWRRLIAMRVGRRRRPGTFVNDAAPPRRPPAPAIHGDAATAHLQEKIRPLEIVHADEAPERLNLLVPTIDLRHLFGGYIAKFNLARRLSESGMRVRIVCVDETLPLPRTWRRQVEAYSGLAGLFDEVEVEFARDRPPLEVSPRDRYVATTFWTAHIADDAARRTGRPRFLYLIQEYEPMTFVMGSWAAVARSTYDLPHVALFSTDLLRDFFSARSYGVFAAGASAGEADSAWFRNAITPVEAPAEAELAARSSRRLLFYARPEPHAARNMFELGLMALSAAVESGGIGPEWELNGIGSVGGGDRIDLAPGRELRLLPRRDQAGYAELLREHDVGLALMLTPHPSLVPIEMAAAGMTAVTNSFETKTAAAVARISSNLVAAEPSLDGIAAALAEATARAGDHRARAAGAALDWPRDWEQALGGPVTERVLSLLDRC